MLVRIRFYKYPPLNGEEDTNKEPRLTMSHLSVTRLAKIGHVGYTRRGTQEGRTRESTKGSDCGEKYRFHLIINLKGLMKGFINLGSSSVIIYLVPIIIMGYFISFFMTHVNWYIRLDC